MNKKKQNTKKQFNKGIENLHKGLDNNRRKNINIQNNIIIHFNN